MCGLFRLCVCVGGGGLHREEFWDFFAGISEFSGFKFEFVTNRRRYFVFIYCGGMLVWLLFRHVPVFRRSLLPLPPGKKNVLKEAKIFLGNVSVTCIVETA